MKNTVLAIACFVLLVALGSCTKTNTCTCVTHTTMDGEPMGEDITTTATIEGDCSDANTTSTTMGITMTVTCD